MGMTRPMKKVMANRPRKVRNSVIRKPPVVVRPRRTRLLTKTGPEPGGALC